MATPADSGSRQCLRCGRLADRGGSLCASCAADEEALTIAPSRSPAEDDEVTQLVTKAGGQALAAAADDTGPLAVGDEFGRYTIVKLLGIGGMGAVYQAWDRELEVVVALKVIRPEVARDPQIGQEIERRFKRELLLARQVTHKNVVRIHDLGEIKGIKYITMTFVDGTDLSTVVKNEGRLSIARVLRIMRSVPPATTINAGPTARA